MALSEKKIRQLKEEFVKEHGPISDEKWQEVVEACTGFAQLAFDVWKEEQFKKR